jgi:ATP-dependent protease ClpP protease subunit
MIILEWNGEIGYWELDSDIVSRDLKNAGGDDITARFSSPGGSLGIGGDIYLALINYRRTYPNAQMILEIGSMAASYGSLIAASPVWNKVKVSDISMAMYHNPANFVYGDYQAMKDNATMLEDARDMYLNIYSTKSGKSDSDTIAMMDKTTWLMGGQAIIDAGFADELITTEGSDDSDMSMIAEKAKMAYKTTMAKMATDSQNSEKPFDYSGAMANMSAIKTTMNTNTSTPVVDNKPTPVGKSKMEVPMTEEELAKFKKDNPEAYKAMMKDGADQEKTKNSERVKSLTEMKDNERYKKVPEMIAVIDDAIKDGKSKDECMTEMNAVMLSVFNNPARMAEMESPEDIVSGDSVVEESEKIGEV